MLNYKACVCQQENVPCFPKGCRDAVRYSSKPLGGGGAVPTDIPARRRRLIHGQHISQQLLTQPQGPQLFLKKLRIKKDLLLIIKNKNQRHKHIAKNLSSSLAYFSCPARIIRYHYNSWASCKSHKLQANQQ